jgi:hypothetical protein
LKNKLRHATAKPRFQIDFLDLCTASLDMLSVERKGSLAILTLAIWKKKLKKYMPKSQTQIKEHHICMQKQRSVSRGGTVNQMSFWERL